MGWTFVVIVSRFLLAISVAFFFFLGNFIYDTITWAYQKILKYADATAFIIIILALVGFAGLVVVEQYQPEVMTVADQTYTCFVIPPMQFGFSFSKTFIRSLWEYLSRRWNDIWSGVFDCFKIFENALLNLPSLTNVAFYTDIIRASFDTAECINLLPFETPSWELPFGLNGLLASFTRFRWCSWTSMREFVLRFIGFDLIRNDQQFCEYDPNAACPLRQLPPSFVPHFPPTVIGLANCETEAVSIDCEFLGCVILALGNATEPIQAILGDDFTPFLEEFARITCCLFTSVYKPPFWAFTGLITLCIDIADVGDFLLEFGIIRFRDCAIDMFILVSGNTITDIFIDLFAIIFPFIQVFIDSYENLVDCYGLQTLCFSSFPANCEVNFVGFGTAGLQTCFSGAGQCIVNGDAGSSIPPNPILSLPPFNFFAQTVVPGIFVFVDGVLCQFIGVITCAFGPTPPGGPLTIPDCGVPGNFQALIGYVNCINDCFTALVPTLAPLTRVFADIMTGVQLFVGSIVNALNFFINIYVDACNEIDGAIPGFPGSLCNVPGVMRTGKREYKYKDFEDYLYKNHVFPNTTCGRILHNQDLQILKRDDLFFWGCLSLKIMGERYESQYPDDLKMDGFMDAHTFMDSLQELYRCELKNITKEMYMRSNQTYRDIGLIFQKTLESKRSMYYPDVISKDGDIGPRSQRHDLIILDESGRIQYNRERLFKSPGNTKNFLIKLWIDIQETPAFNFVAAYIAIHKTFTKEFYNRHGYIPWSDKPRVEPPYKISDVFPQNSTDLQTLDFRVNSITKDFYDPKNQIIKKLDEEMMKEKMLRVYSLYVSAAIGTFQDWMDTRRVIIEERIKARRKNLRLPEKDNIPALHRYQKKTYFITPEELKSRAEAVRKFKDASVKAWGGIGKVYDNIDPNRKLIPAIMSISGLERTDIYKTGHMFFKSNIDPDSAHNMSLFFTRNLEYDTEEGFMSMTEYKEKWKAIDSESNFLWKMLKGEYNPRHPKKIGPFGSDPAAFHNTMGSLQKTVRNYIGQITMKRKLEKMIELGIDPESLEGREFKVTSIDKLTDNFFVKFIEYLFNEVISTISKLFGGGRIFIDLGKILEDWINSFDPQEIIEDTAAKALNYFDDLFICDSPEDYDGTNNYNPFCLPFLPEFALMWMEYVGEGNVFFPLQLGIFPTALISQNCDQPFNGDNYLWHYRPTNACPIMDGQTRPFCTDPNFVCDWCERQFTGCSAIQFDDSFDSIFFILGFIPVALQEFYTGVITTSTLTLVLLFLWVFILNIGGLNIAFYPYVGVPVTLGIYLVIHFFDVTFGGLSSPGSEGGIPIGMVYLLIWLVMIYFIPGVLQSLPKSLTALFGAGLSLSWVVNLFYRFTGIRSVLNFNGWAASVLGFFQRAPQPLAFFNFWGSLVDKANRFNYSSSQVPYEDTWCFFATFSNFLILIIGVLILADIIQIFFTFFVRLVLFFGVVLTALLQLIADLRFWWTKERLRDIEDELDRFKQQTNDQFSLQFDSSLLTYGGNDDFSSLLQKLSKRNLSLRENLE